MKLTRDDVTIVNPQMSVRGLHVQWKLIEVDGRHCIISAYDRVNYRGHSAPECMAMHATTDGEVIHAGSLGDSLYDATLVDSIDHEECITALLAHLNGEPAPAFERPAPPAKPEPAAPVDVMELVRQKAATDPALSDDAFVLISRALDGRPLFDERSA